MAKLMSKKTKEIVQTVAVLVIVALILTFYVIYPLITIPDMTARANRDDFLDPEYTLPNDPSYFVEAGLSPDTITVLSNDNIRLATLYFRPDSAFFDSIRGTVILLHPDDTDRTAMVSYIRPLLDSGLAVVAYDQRAFGHSGGRYHFAGDYEADDLVEMVVYLNIHEMLAPPVMAVGYNLGGDAIINAEHDENRILAAVAVDPYLSSTRWIQKIKEKADALSIPLYNMVYYWWFQKFSGYPFDRTNADDIRAVDIPTTIYMSASESNCDEIKKLEEISPKEILTVNIKPDDDNELRRQILSIIYAHIKPDLGSE